MKKRFALSFIILTLLFVLLSGTVLAGYPCEYCSGTVHYIKTGTSPTYSKNTACIHGLEGSDHVVYHYNYYAWKCVSCGFIYDTDAIYTEDSRTCYGYYTFM